MFRINRRTDYAVRVMLCLAKHPVDNRISTKVIQNETKSPRAFLQRIIADLSKAELIHTYPGPNGGVQLAHRPEAISLRHIWEAIEGPLLISDCLKNPRSCPLNEGCPVTGRWDWLQTVIVHELEATTLDQLAREAYRLETVLSQA